MTPESPHSLIPTSSSGLIRKMDHRLDLVNKILGEIEARQTTELSPRFEGSYPGECRSFEIHPGVSIDMCWCPPGTFLMGSPEDEEGRCGNEEQVKVTLTKGYWMGKTQVTQEQWKAVMGRNPSEFRGATRPVETVSWNNAQAFLQKINNFNKISDGGRMKLPTEAQWEYACRAGETGPYSGGTLDEIAWYRGNSKGKTHPVATKQPNAWGLYDMHGNVWEWCSDFYHTRSDYFDSINHGVFDPVGPESGYARVLRNARCSAYAYQCRAACRWYASASPDELIRDIGFRVARIPAH